MNKISSKYGTFAIFGNHEYITGIDKSRNYINGLNITLLEDTALFIDNSFYLVGRWDKFGERITGQKRKTTANLLDNCNKNFPIILLDHQPFDLEYHSKLGVDLQLSGHTHKGQLFPFNYITSAIFEHDYGYKKINNTHFYVSNGYGTAGTPVRVGNTPEIVVVNLQFNE